MRPIFKVVAGLTAAIAVVAFAQAQTPASGPTVDGEVVPTYRELSPSDPEAKALWADFVKAGGIDGRAPDGRGASVLVSTNRVGPDVWTETMLSNDGWCGTNTCSARVFRNADLMFSGEVCTNIASHVLRPAQLVFRACEESFPLAPIDQR